MPDRHVKSQPTASLAPSLPSMKSRIREELVMGILGRGWGKGGAQDNGDSLFST